MFLILKKYLCHWDLILEGVSILEKLENILSKTIDMLEESKEDMFSISESSRSELQEVKKELEDINEDIGDIIDKIDVMERRNQRARFKLMQVSRDIYRHTEEDIKEAYEEAENTSVKIAVLREKEEQLKERRRNLEKRTVRLKKTIKKAEKLVSRVGVVRQYLFGELGNISEQVDNMRQKQKIALRIIEAQEAERKRVAREIHDGPAQSLANLIFRVELSEQLLDEDIEKARKELQELKGIVRSSVRDVRKIIFDLRPMSLDDLGLVPTLKRYIEKFVRDTEINIDFRVIGTEERLKSAYEVTIFRLVQEALNNIYKHSGANAGKVILEFAEQQVNIAISDNGVGFDTDDIPGNKYGLISMRERCQLVNGEFDIVSKKNQGTRINIHIPLKKEEG